MAGQSDGMDYIMPMKYEQDIKTVKKEEWLDLLDIILEKCIYEAVILISETALTGCTTS